MGKLRLKTLFERLRYRMFGISAICGGTGPDKEFPATDRFTRYLSWPTSGESTPVRLRLEMSRAVTRRREGSHVTPRHVQWLVVAFHDKSADCGSSVTAAFIDNRARYSGILAGLAAAETPR